MKSQHKSGDGLVRQKTNISLNPDSSSVIPYGVTWSQFTHCGLVTPYQASGIFGNTGSSNDWIVDLWYQVNTRTSWSQHKSAPPIPEPTLSYCQNTLEKINETLIEVQQFSHRKTSDVGHFFGVRYVNGHVLHTVSYKCVCDRRHYWWGQWGLEEQHETQTFCRTTMCLGIISVMTYGCSSFFGSNQLFEQLIRTVFKLVLPDYFRPRQPTQ